MVSTAQNRINVKRVVTFRNTTDHSEEDKDMLLSIKAINKKQEISKIEQKQNQQYLKKLVALLICSKFCCVHMDRALLFNIIGGWKFSTSLSSTLRSQMVSTSCGLNTKHGEAPMRFQPACLSPLGSKHLRMSNRLKCSQTIAVDKTASFTAFALYARNYFNMTRIAHTFLEKGHTETEIDSIHAQNRTPHTRAMVCCCEGRTHFKTNTW